MHKKINVLVYSAMEIGETAKKRIQSFVENKTFDKGANIVYAIDKKLIGGVLIKIGDTVYDGTILRQLDKLR